MDVRIGGVRDQLESHRESERIPRHKRVVHFIDIPILPIINLRCRLKPNAERVAVPVGPARKRRIPRPKNLGDVGAGLGLPKCPSNSFTLISA